MKKNTIVLIVAFLTFIPPTIKLWNAITITQNLDDNLDSSNIGDFMSNIENYRNSVGLKKINSENFCLYISPGLMTDSEVNTYLEWIEKKYQKILDYMKCREAIEKDNRPIEVFLLDASGTSFCGGDYFVVYYGLDFQGVSVHEMTHSLDFKLARQEMLNNETNKTYNDFLELLTANKEKSLSDDFSLFFLEQRAVLMENKFGEKVGFPNFGLPINPMIYEGIRNGLKIEPFEKLNDNELMEDGLYDISSFRYSVAGSFGKFLSKRYGFNHYNKVIAKGYKGVFYKSLDELEEEWRLSLKRSFFIQRLFMTIAVLIVLIIAQFWLKQKSKTFLFGLPAIVLLLLSFLSWGYFLSYGDNYLFGLVLAVIVGGVLKIWKTKAGIIALWVIGFLTAILPQVI